MKCSGRRLLGLFQGVEKSDFDEESDAVLVGQIAEPFDDFIGLGFVTPQGSSETSTRTGEWTKSMAVLLRYCCCSVGLAAIWSVSRFSEPTL